ncbi:hypothetical protein P280DRAFT_536273 [Massarina eburnea CBS 473.64]|uniref:Uncharacterized protein n=1 Tax=Massarina eburnea CBS 473.64 TaxID=1395130 RepID=A0A6A6RJR0_9PLEO|nr:hypothetical protein P280DRAFT_536273 [Massarina eburnea CBS 473.64]
MPPVKGFSDNVFQTHADFKVAGLALLRPLKAYQSPGGARIKLPLTTGTHFDDIAAQLEGYARPLWAIGTLVHGNCLTPEETEELVEPYVRGLANGTDPDHEEYWGDVVVRDQRMVEMEIISFALLAAPDAFFHSQTAQVKGNIKRWLFACNGKDFPVTNWLWFRVMTNLALVKVCGVPYEEVKGSMEADLREMDNFDLGEGWSADGSWTEDGRQADYYSGSFAVQFSQLIYAKFAHDLDPRRCEKFKQKARDFALAFWRYFDDNGAAIPFGRSLSYRFAFAGFWSVVAFAEVDIPAPLNDWGVVKGLLLRHYRWWAQKHDIFNIDSTLTIGFAYPNMYMSEDYNSPQSPYWAMKSFLALALPSSHPFWTAEEKPLPTVAKTSLATVVKPSFHILCNTGNHHFLLSSGQFCPWPLKATEAKYGKFAYSSHFGFSVPTGPILMQLAPDSTLALSKDGGDTWRVPWKVLKYEFRSAKFMREGKEEEDVPALWSVWKPWRDADVEVETTLLAPSSRWPDWYVRMHRIVNKGTSEVNIQAVQGGFSIQGRGDGRGEVLPTRSSISELSTTRGTAFPEGTLETLNRALICSNAGASGICHLSSHGLLEEQVESRVLKPDANTNLMWQRTLIPTINIQLHGFAAGTELSFTTGVFALARRFGQEEKYEAAHIGTKWEDTPIVCRRSEVNGVGECIVVP